MSETSRRIEAELVSPEGMRFPITAALDLHSVSEAGPRFSVTDFRYCKDNSAVAIQPGWKIESTVNFAEAMGWT